jgi:U3 small nucleolar RNA-associated protein 15
LNFVAGKPEHVIRSHQKSVQTLASAQHGTRILTGALDGHVKVHNTASWEVVAGFKYPSPILSLAVIPSPAGNEADRDDRHLAVGLQSGLLSLRTRVIGTEKVKAREREKKMQALLAGEADEYERKQKKKDTRQGIRARDRGKDFRGEGADIVITGNDRQRIKKLRPWQKSLRAGEYAQALDLVIPPDGWKEFDKDDFLTLLVALRHRSALRTALANRSEHQLLPVLTLTHKYISYPQHVGMLYDVLLCFLDLYSHRMGDWQNDDGEGKEIFSLVKKIHVRIVRAQQWADQAQRMLGMVDLLESG